MKKSARIFNCHRCRELVAICSHCDRGNIFCSKKCSSASRNASLKRSSNKYQKSRKGRHKHAARQHRYRKRRRQKVTQHTSPLLNLSDLLHHASKPRLGAHPVLPVHAHADIYCIGCGDVCSPYLRLNLLGGRGPPSVPLASSINQVKRSKTIGY